jgi:hypothetical protein
LGLDRGGCLGLDGEVCLGLDGSEEESSDEEEEKETCFVSVSFFSPFKKSRNKPKIC